MLRCTLPRLRSLISQNKPVCANTGTSMISTFSSSPSSSDRVPDIAEALQFCVDLAYEAGAKALTFCENRPRPSRGATTEEQDQLTSGGGDGNGEEKAQRELHVQQKEDESPVTIADKLVNELIVSRLHEKYCSSVADGGGVRVIGEESVGTINKDLGTGDVFYVDPIDGTKEFIRNNGEWAVMIGLVRDGAACMGVVYHAEADHMYYAIEGGGCFVVRETGTSAMRLKRNATYSVKDMILVKSRSHPDERIDAVAKNLGIVRSNVTGSFGLKCARFAEGKTDFYINTRSSFWDSVPSEVIVREAGGVLVEATSTTDSKGERKRYNGLKTDNTGTLVTCPREVQEVIVSEVRQVFLG